MRLNLYWGDSPMSWLRYLTVASFQALNPDWKVRVWTGAVDTRPTWITGQRYEYSEYRGRDWREELDVEWATIDFPGQPANICADLTRWKVLADGEMFADFDILFLNPIDAYLDVLSKPSLTFDPHFALGLCGGGEPFGAVYEHALRMATPNVYQSAGVLPLYDLACGSGYDIRGVGDESTWDNLTSRIGHLERIPMCWVHPHGAERAHQRPVPDTLGYHWYGGLAESQRLAATLTPDTLDDSFISDAIRRLRGIHG